MDTPALLSITVLHRLLTDFRNAFHRQTQGPRDSIVYTVSQVNHGHPGINSVTVWLFTGENKVDIAYNNSRRRSFWHATQDCVAPYI